MDNLLTELINMVAGVQKSQAQTEQDVKKSRKGTYALVAIILIIVIVIVAIVAAQYSTSIHLNAQVNSLQQQLQAPPPVA